MGSLRFQNLNKLYKNYYHFITRKEITYFLNLIQQHEQGISQLQAALVKLDASKEPTTSGAAMTMTELEELLDEKDRLTQKLTAATAAADSESDQVLTQEDVEAAVSQACAPNTCLDTDRSLRSDAEDRGCAAQVGGDGAPGGAPAGRA